MPRSTKNCLRTEPPAAEDYSGRQRTAGGGGRLREPGARGTKGRAPEAGGKRRGARAGGLGALGSRLPRCVAPRSGGAVRGARAPAAAITAQHARVLGAPEDEATARGHGGPPRTWGAAARQPRGPRPRRRCPLERARGTAAPAGAETHPAGAQRRNSRGWGRAGRTPRERRPQRRRDGKAEQVPGTQRR